MATGRLPRRDFPRLDRRAVLAGLATALLAGCTAAGTTPRARSSAAKPAQVPESRLGTDLAGFARDKSVDPSVQVAQEGGQFRVTLPEAAIFPRGEPAFLFEDGAATLAALAKVLRAHPEVRLQIIGHTDDTGTIAYAQDLTERQADTVADALVADGVRRASLRSWGVGGLEPVAPNDSPQNRTRNRRVEIVIA